MQTAVSRHAPRPAPAAETLTTTAPDVEDNVNDAVLQEELKLPPRASLILVLSANVLMQVTFRARRS